MNIHDPEGATPLDPDLMAALIPDLSTQGELNEFEAQNIAEALRWALRSRTLKRDLLTRSGLMLLHKRMFDQTWRWAGKFRTTDTNIGVSWHQVPTMLQNLCDDTQYQLENAVYDWDELAARFHHRLVWIHPFPNGNGRHARLATDLLLAYYQQPIFTWGSVSLITDNTTRQKYLSSLRAADAGEFTLLLRFVRS